MNKQQREVALRMVENFRYHGFFASDREVAALLRSLAEEPPAKQEPLTDADIEDMREECGIAWTGDFYRCESLELGSFARAIESGCAKKWGVEL